MLLCGRRANVRDHSHNQISEVDIYMDEGGEGEGHTTTSIIILPLAPANPLPPKVYVNCAMTVLFKTKKTVSARARYAVGRCGKEERRRRGERTYVTKNM